MAEDSELDRLVRASLERRAGEVDTATPVAEKARGAVRRRRQGRIAVGAAAALVVAAAVTGFVVRGDNDRTPPVTDRGEDSLPTEWRTEYWRDMKVDVPAEWGYGGAPMRSGGSMVSCFPGAGVGPDGRPVQDEATRGYVGRPIGLTDVCVMYPDNRPGGPQVPYVWLGAEIETGIVELGNGFVQETVEVNGSTLTVGTNNPELRGQILESAGGGEQCFSELEKPPSSTMDAGFGGPADGMTVCAYARDQDDAIGLTYSAVLGREAARAFEKAFREGEAIPVGRACDVGGDDNWVVLSIEGRTYVVSTQARGCPQVEGPDSPSVLPVTLSLDMARPWAVGGIPAVVAASPGQDDQWMWRLFIGPQG